MNDIVTNKIQCIQRCIVRAREEYGADPASFGTNYTRQDAAILNVLLACEQTIDLANHVIRAKKLGIPTATAESFELLYRRGIIGSELSDKLRRMAHFRNTVIHQYQRLDIEIVKAVIVSGLDDLIEFGDMVLAFIEGDER